MLPVEIDVFSDIVCPWCYIGAARLERAIAALPEGSQVSIKYHPFLLQPDTPAAGIDIPTLLRQRYGAEPREIFARVEAAARESGLGLDLARQPRMYSTLRGHTLLRHAAAKGTQTALARALFQANFEGEDISADEVLLPLAEAQGFSREEASRLLGDAAELERTRNEAREAARRGIRGVPFYVINGQPAFSGAQPEAVFRQLLERAQR